MKKDDETLFESINLEELDVEELEERLEMAVAAVPCTGCNNCNALCTNQCASQDGSDPCQTQGDGGPCSGQNAPTCPTLTITPKAH